MSSPVHLPAPLRLDEKPDPPAIFGPAEDLLQIKDEQLKLARVLESTFPDETGVLDLLGDIHYEHGDIAQSMAAWERGFTLAPQRVDLLRKLGTAAEALDDPNRAVAYWQQALEIDPNRPNLRWHLAKVRIDQGRHEQAVVLLERECELSPRAGRNFFLLGQTYLQLEQHGKAIENFEKALEIQPDFYNAYYGLGNAYLRSQNRPKAQAAMQRYQELKRRDGARPDKQVKIDEVPDARRRMAEHYLQAYYLYQRRGQPSAGVWLLQRAVQLDPGNTLYLEVLGVHYYQQKQIDAALRVYARAQAIDPNNVRFYLNRGKIWASQNQPAEAERMFLQTISRFPQESLGYTELAELYLRAQRNIPRALDLTRQALGLEETARNYFLLAWAKDTQGDFAQALEAIGKAVALAPGNSKYRVLQDNLKQKVSSHAN